MAHPNRPAERPLGYMDPLGLSEADRQALIATISADPGAAGSERRSALRVPVNLNAWIPVHMHQGNGGVGRYIAYPIDFSSTGISFLHGGFVHDGTICDLQLRTVRGELLSITASTVRCRHLKGIAHEIGAMFRDPVDPEMFLPSLQRPTPGAPSAAPAGTGAMDGALLLTLARELAALSRVIDGDRTALPRVRALLETALASMGETGS